jgi:hypothetical protein
MAVELVKSLIALRMGGKSAVMQPKFWQGILVAAGISLVASAAHAASCNSFTSAPAGEINPGPSINGANPDGTTPLICNGSRTSPSATGSAITTIYLGFSAGNSDNLSIDVNGTVFNNKSTTPGTTSTVGVTPGTLTLTLDDVTSGNVFHSGQAYTNPFPNGSSSVYHFADFSFANAAAYDAFAPFDSVTGNLTTAEINTILDDGGFGAWTFIGAEDLASTSNDDWNDLIFAIGPAATPIPATLPLFAGGLGALGWFGGRRKRKASSALATA